MLPCRLKKITLLCSVWILCALVCPVFAQHVLINEILYDTPGVDAPAQLFTELCGTPGVSLSGWSLVGVSGATGTVYRTVNLSGTIPDDGCYVIANTDDSLYVDRSLDLGIGEGIDWDDAGGPSGDDCDGIELRHGISIIDRVCYGYCAAGHVCNGEGDSNAPDAYPVGNLSYSLSRCPDNEDTDNNALDWVIAVPTPGSANQCPCRTLHLSILQAQEDTSDGTPLHAGEFVSLRGIATIGSDVFNPQETDFYIQDDSAGINIRCNPSSTNVMAGDCVLVEGWLSHVNGLCQIISEGFNPCIPILDVIEHTSLPHPIEINCQTARISGEHYEGMLVKLTCVTIVGGDPWPETGQEAELAVIDGTGLLHVYLDSDTDIDGQAEPDAPVSITGILSQQDTISPYTENYRLLPRSWSDFASCSQAVEKPIPHPQHLQLTGCYPNPFNAQTRISFTVSHSTIVSIEIFDVLGRQVKETTITISSAGEQSYIWNGKTSSGQTLSTGLYFVQLKAGQDIVLGKLLYIK